MILNINKIKFYINNLFWVGLAAVLSPLIFFILLFRKKRQKPKNLLVIQTAKIGDMVCTTPVFREIKTKYPNAHLTLVCLPMTEGIVKKNPYLDKIKTIDPSSSGNIDKLKFIVGTIKEKYDWGFSMNPDGFNASILFLGLIKNRVFINAKNISLSAKFLAFFQNYKIFYPKQENMSSYYLKSLKFIDINQSRFRRDVYCTPAARIKADKFISSFPEKLVIGISITSGNTFKQWEFDYWVELVNRLTQRLNAYVILIGSSRDKEYNDKLINKIIGPQKILNIAGEFDLEELPALVEKFKLFISVDTGTSYIADALNVPTITIVGPNDMNTQSPINKFMHIGNNLYCAPCAFIVPTARSCREGHRRCFKETSPDMVWEGVLEIIKKYDIKQV